LAEDLREKCGIVGIIGVPDAAHVAFDALEALQHRGQESSGVVTIHNGEYYRHADNGLVKDVFNPAILHNLPGDRAVGHNRYSTSGGDGHLSPTLEAKAGIALAINGNQDDVSLLEARLDEVGINHSTYNDVEMQSALLGHDIANGLNSVEALRKNYSRFKGAFAGVLLTDTTLIAFCDPHGVKPLSIGRFENGGIIVASETCAIKALGATVIGAVNAGELLEITENAIVSHQLVEPNPKLDIFELLYFASPDSDMAGQSIRTTRENFGRILAKEHPVKADLVLAVPSSAIPAAEGYAEVSKIPYDGDILIKNPGTRRSFIEPTQEAREEAVKNKLRLAKDVSGQKIILIDDTLVRGTTLRHAVQMLYAAGAAEVHVRIAAPPIRYPDFYGTDMPSQAELLAANYNAEEICAQLGAKSLAYLSLDGMITATGQPRERFCLAALTGEYPIDIGKRRNEITFFSDQKTRQVVPAQGRATHSPSLAYSAAPQDR
jgi:amidophosphoribosyltransferase